MPRCHLNCFILLSFLTIPALQKKTQSQHTDQHTNGNTCKSCHLHDADLRRYTGKADRIDGLFIFENQ